MKILQVCQTYPPEWSGGSTVYVVMLSEDLAKRGHEIHMLCNTRDSSIKPGELHESTAGPFRVLRIGQLGKTYGGSYPRKIGGVCRELCKRGAYDVVHVHTSEGLGEVILRTARESGIPSVVTLHDGSWVCGNIFFMRTGDERVCRSALFSQCLRCQYSHLIHIPIVAWPRALVAKLKYIGWITHNKKDILRLADHYIAVCAYYQRQYESFGVHGRFSTIRTQVRESAIGFKPIRTVSRPVRIGALGALRLNKGAPRLMRALLALKDRSDSFRLDIWGPADPDTLALFRETVEDSPVFIHGPYERQELDNIFEQIDVLVDASTWFSYPLIVLEALASRTPVVAARAHGTPELVEDGQNGILFDPYDETSLPQALRSIVDEPSRITEMQSRIVPPLPYSAFVEANLQVYAMVVAPAR